MSSRRKLPSHVELFEWRRKRANVYTRRPTGSPVLTYAYEINPRLPDGGLVRLEWDYQIEWLPGGRPTVVLIEYRAYRRDGYDAALVPVDRTATDIPVCESILWELSRHAAAFIFADSYLRGSWCEAEAYLLRGAAKALRAGCTLADYRESTQLRFKIRRFPHAPPTQIT